jgi:hypothetical protein
MTPPRIDPALARDVAKQLDRRRIRRRLLVWTTLLAAVVVAAMYLTCGHGFGLGGAGPGSDEGPGPGSVKALVAAKRCALRVAAAGITVDGKPMPRDEAAAACKATGGADVVVTGDARQGDWKDLRAALETAGVTDIVVHQPPRH